MKTTFYTLSVILTFNTLYSQEEPVNLNNSNFEFKLGYANFHKDYNGGFIGAGYNYHLNDYLLGQANISFDFGENSETENMGKTLYQSGNLTLGLKGELPIGKKHSFRAGPDFGVMLLNLNRSDITDDPLLLPIIYGFSFSYFVDLSNSFKVGLTFVQQYMTNFDFTNQRFGAVLILN